MIGKKLSAIQFSLLALLLLKIICLSWKNMVYVQGLSEMFQIMD